MIKKILLTLVGILASAAAHGQIAISQLPNANLPLTGAEQTIVNQNGSTRKTTVSSFGAIFPPLNATYILQSPNAGVPNSRTLVGTANEILLSDGGPLGNLVLSTPQPICTTCSPTFSGATLTGVLNGTAALFSSTLQSSGYTGTTGTFSSTLQSSGYTGTTGTFSSTLQSNGYTGTTGSFSGALSAGSFSLTTPLPASSGGTGFGTYTIGDILAANSSTTLVRVNDVAAGSYFRSGGAGVLPLWSTLTLPNAATTGDLLVATGTNAIGNLTAVAAGRYLRSNGAGAAPVYSTVTIPNTAVLGDIWYGSAANVVSALAGNITTTKQFLTQTGTGTVSATPAWGVITASDLPGGFSGFANPTGLIGLTANNGVATTGTRSDATHALDQSIVPTWTGIHTFTPRDVHNGGETVSPSSGFGIVFQSGAVSAANSFISPSSDQTVYSLLGRTQAGPGIQARWDSASGNRYLSFGQYDNTSTYTETLRIQNLAVTYMNGGNQAFVAFGTVTNNGTVCAVAPTVSNFGIASCTRTGTGQVTVTFSGTDSLLRGCVGIVAGSPGFVSILSRATNTAGLASYNSAAVLTDQNIEISCW